MYKRLTSRNGYYVRRKDITTIYSIDFSNWIELTDSDIADINTKQLAEEEHW